VTFQLSHDLDPGHIRYEFVQPNLVLPPGRYFALFGPRWETDGGVLLGRATSPIPLNADGVVIGSLDPQTGLAMRIPDHAAAVRILGKW